MVYAEDEGSLWDNYADDTGAPAQKYVPDKDFDKAIEGKMRRKKKNKNIPKGEMYRDSNETDFITDIPAELPLLSVPLNLYIAEDSIIPAGHYQVKGEKIDGKPVLKFYQAHYLMAQIPAIETKDDFGQQQVNFVKLIDHSAGQVKIIFGGIDFNAYAVIDTAQ